METFNNTINTVTNLHVYIKCPMTKQCILSVAKLIELVKLLKFELKKYSNEMFNTILCLCQHQIYQALLIILYAKVSQDPLISVYARIYIITFILFFTNNRRISSHRH